MLPFLCWFVFIIDIIENNLHTFVHAEDSVLGISTWHVLAHPEIVSLKIPPKKHHRNSPNSKSPCKIHHRSPTPRFPSPQISQISQSPSNLPIKNVLLQLPNLLQLRNLLQWLGAGESDAGLSASASHRQLQTSQPRCLAQKSAAACGAWRIIP